MTLHLGRYPAVAVALLGLAFLPAVSNAASPSQPSQASAAAPGLYLGTAWYPEQWPEAEWESDLALMEKAGVRFVRITEFAWSRMEPAEGQFQLDWVEHAIRAAEKHHIAVVLGTPGAAPPAWLTQKYPETLRTEENGRVDEHGNRQQFRFTSAKYRELVGRITTEMAKRFGHDPNVIGWQIDNEIGAESFDAETRAQFQQWLKAHYGTLDNLNKRWTAAYWSEDYSDWSQVPIEEKYGNPGLLLSWKRFVSDTWRSYCRLHIDAIRAHADKRQWITTNTMGWFDAYDHYTVEQDLDLAAWDDYVGTGHLDPVRNGAAHDLTRGFKRKNFWIMETQPGMVNWSANNNMLDKGEVRAMAWHDVGHGADAVSYWQWRSALNGQEEYHGTLVGSDGTPVPLYPEVSQLGAEFAKAGPVLQGTSVHSEVALLHSYESRWAVNWQRHNKAFDPIEALLSYYGPVRAAVHSVDIVPPTAPLSQYKLVIAPALNLLTPKDAENLIAYVRGGGHLVLGQRSGMKDEDNGWQPKRQPGPLVDLLGGRVEQFYALEKSVPLNGEWAKGKAGEGTIWAEQLSTSDPATQVLMRYGKSNGWLDEQPAAITRQVGKGRITYIGAWPDPETMKAATDWMLQISNVKPSWGTMPDGVDLYLRDGNGKHVAILANFGKEPQTVTLPAKMTDVLHGGTVERVTLKRFDVAVLSQ